MGALGTKPWGRAFEALQQSPCVSIVDEHEAPKGTLVRIHIGVLELKPPSMEAEAASLWTRCRTHG